MSGMPSMLSMYNGVQEFGKVTFLKCWGGWGKEIGWMSYRQGSPRAAKTLKNLFKIHSLEKTLMLGGIGGSRRRGQQRMRCWMASLTRWT